MTTLIAIAGIFTIAGFIQGFTGFGSGLIAIPLLCLVVDFKFAIPLAALNGLVITSFLALRLRSHLELSKLAPLCLASLPGVVVGVTLLKNVHSRTMALLLGILLIGYSSYNLFLSPRPRGLHRNWGYLAGFCAGAIGSAFSTGGPPVIIYTTLTGWSKEYIKATLTGFFFFGAILVTSAHAVTGLTTAAVFKAFLLSAPFVFFGTLVGNHCYGLVSGTHYIKSIYILLILLGGMMITVQLP